VNKVIAIREDAMKGKVKALRILKAMQMFLIGVEIEIMRKFLELKIRVKKNLTSSSVIRLSNNLSRLGIKWMILSASTQRSPAIESRV
jgi:hypothetical protein